MVVRFPLPSLFDLASFGLLVGRIVAWSKACLRAIPCFAPASGFTSGGVKLGHPPQKKIRFST